MAKQKKATKNVNKNRKNIQTSKEVLKNSYGNDELNKVIKCVAIVLAVFIVMYLITVLILKKSSTDYITKDETRWGDGASHGFYVYSAVIYDKHIKYFGVTES